MNTMDRDEPVQFGATNHDEMCNFYIMFNTPHQDDLKVQYCSRKSQVFKWNDYFENIPELASSLDGVKLSFPEMELHHHANHKRHQMRLV